MIAIEKRSSDYFAYVDELAVSPLLCSSLEQEQESGEGGLVAEMEKLRDEIESLGQWWSNQESFAFPPARGYLTLLSQVFTVAIDTCWAEASDDGKHCIILLLGYLSS